MLALNHEGMMNGGRDAEWTRQPRGAATAAGVWKIFWDVEGGRIQSLISGLNNVCCIYVFCLIASDEAHGVPA